MLATNTVNFNILINWIHCRRAAGWILVDWGGGRGDKDRNSYICCFVAYKQGCQKVFQTFSMSLTNDGLKWITFVLCMNSFCNELYEAFQTSAAFCAYKLCHLRPTTSDSALRISQDFPQIPTSGDCALLSWSCIRGGTFFFSFSTLVSTGLIDLTRNWCWS